MSLNLFCRLHSPCGSWSLAVHGGPDSFVVIVSGNGYLGTGAPGLSLSWNGSWSVGAYGEGACGARHPWDWDPFREGEALEAYLVRIFPSVNPGLASWMGYVLADPASLLVSLSVMGS